MTNVLSASPCLSRWPSSSPHVSSHHSQLAQYLAMNSESVLSLYLSNNRCDGLCGWCGNIGAYQRKNGLLLFASRKSKIGCSPCRPIFKPSSPWRPPLV